MSYVVDAKLWKVSAGGSFLAFMASAVNAHFLLSLGISVSHLTGDAARMAIDLARLEGPGLASVARLGYILAAFVLGASVSGFFLSGQVFSLQRPYGRSVLLIGGLLVAGWALESRSLDAACALAAAACGLQNALATHFRGLVLRTTHITGVLTDVGHMLGMRAAGHKVEPWKLRLHLTIVATFVIGAAAGTMLHLALPQHALLVLGLGYWGAGLFWYLFLFERPVRPIG
jgi:uncharacterized membrane protein YoaK (UPF0700 family)